MSQERKVKEVIDLFDRQPANRGPPPLRHRPVVSPKGIIGLPLKDIPVHQPQVQLDPSESLSVEPGPSPQDIELSFTEEDPPTPPRRPRPRQKSLATTVMRITSSASSAFDEAFDSNEEVDEAEKTEMLPAGTFILKEAAPSKARKARVSTSEEATLSHKDSSGELLQPVERHGTHRLSLSRVRRRLSWRGHGQELIVDEYEVNRAREESFLSGGDEEEVKEISAIAARLGKGQIKKALTLKFENEPDARYIRQATTRRLAKLKTTSVQGRTLHDLPDPMPAFRYVDPERFDDNDPLSR